MFVSRIIQKVCKLSIIVLGLLPVAYGNNGTTDAKDIKVNVDPYKFVGTSARQHPGHHLFDFRKNGIRVDVRVVPAARNDSARSNDNDGFPQFPTKDIGSCIISFSLVCAKERVSRYVESLRELNEIYLMGQEIKLVKARVINDRRSDNDSSIERSVNNFFDTFALRITLPKWNGKREKNQIDVMLDETALSEGRGKGGGGGGGKGGGKCKMMMMAGLMMLKMKLMGIATIKGMMMAGMSLMLTMAMFMHKYMKGGGGGYGGGGGNGQYKEIVLLTKSSGGGGGGGGGGCCSPSDSYAAPPPSSYGPPSGGGGYGGGWGRSFGRRFITTDYDRNYTVGSINSSPAIEKSILDNGTPMSSNFSSSKWNFSNYDDIQGYHRLNNNTNNVRNNTNVEPLLHSGSANFAINTSPYQNEDSKDYNVDPIPASYVDNVNQAGSPNYVTSNYDTNVARPIYADEWDATNDKVLLSNLKREAMESG